MERLAWCPTYVLPIQQRKKNWQAIFFHNNIYLLLLLLLLQITSVTITNTVFCYMISITIFISTRYADSVHDVFKLAKKEAVARAVFFGFVSFLAL